MHWRGPDNMSGRMSIERALFRPGFVSSTLAREDEREPRSRVLRGYGVFRSLCVASPVEISKRLRESMGHVCIEFPKKTGTWSVGSDDQSYNSLGLTIIYNVFIYERVRSANFRGPDDGLERRSPFRSLDQ
jgi:hypothetical protein